MLLRPGEMGVRVKKYGQPGSSSTIGAGAGEPISYAAAGATCPTTGSTSGTGRVQTVS